MSKDPAFLFYPGDYLRDTQTLSEKSQVAYDRIMCEHMRNICISQQQLKFFTKKLNPDEIEELMYTLNKIESGYQIQWVAESIEKRRAYSESRRKNRSNSAKKNKKKKGKTYDEHMITYDEHMENENENENVNRDVIESEKKVRAKKFKKPKQFEVQEYMQIKLLEGGLSGVSSENESERFYDYYQSNGWKVGKNAMKDWKCAVRNWIRNLKERHFNHKTINPNNIKNEKTPEQKFAEFKEKYR